MCVHAYTHTQRHFYFAARTGVNSSCVKDSLGIDERAWSFLDQLCLLKMAAAGRRDHSPVNVISRQNSSFSRAQKQGNDTQGNGWCQTHVRRLTVFISTSTVGWSLWEGPCGAHGEGETQTVPPQRPLFLRTHAQEQSLRSCRLSCGKLLINFPFENASSLWLAIIKAFLLNICPYPSKAWDEKLIVVGKERHLRDLLSVGLTYEASLRLWQQLLFSLLWQMWLTA